VKFGDRRERWRGMLVAMGHPDLLASERVPGRRGIGSAFANVSAASSNATIPCFGPRLSLLLSTVNQSPVSLKREFLRIAQPVATHLQIAASSSHRNTAPSAELEQNTARHGRNMGTRRSRSKVSRPFVPPCPNRANRDREKRHELRTRRTSGLIVGRSRRRWQIGHPHTFGYTCSITYPSCASTPAPVPLRERAKRPQNRAAWSARPSRRNRRVGECRVFLLGVRGGTLRQPTVLWYRCAGLQTV